MLLLSCVLLACAVVWSGVAASPAQQSWTRRETRAEAAANVRRLMQEETMGSIATVFPEETDHAGAPFAMLEYHAPCHTLPSLTFLLLPISLSVQNILHSMNHSATYMLKEPYRNKDSSIPGRPSPMDHGRVSLIGNMSLLNDISPKESKSLAQCYTRYHPDAKSWLPGADDSPHYSVWARFDVHDVYYVGGFGDTHYIGHLTPEEIAGL